MDKKVDNSGHVPVVPPIQQQKCKRQKRLKETLSGKNFAPTKDKEFIFKVKKRV